MSVTTGSPTWPRLTRRRRSAVVNLGRGDTRENVPAPASREGMDSLSALLDSHRREGVAVQAEQAGRWLRAAHGSVFRACGIVGPRRCPTQRYGKCHYRQPCRRTEEEVHRRPRKSGTADYWQDNSGQGRASLASRAPSTSGLRGPTCGGHSVTAGFVPLSQSQSQHGPWPRAGPLYVERYHTAQEHDNVHLDKF